MLKYIIITKELHYDNYEECNKDMALYRTHDYKIMEYGSEDDWYFIAERR